MIEDLKSEKGRRSSAGRPKKGDQSNRPEQILAAGIKLYAEHGFEAVSNKHIAEEAGVATSLISHHFGDKAGFRSACNRFVLDEMGRVLSDAMEAIDRYTEFEQFDAWLAQVSPQNVYTLRYLALLFLQEDDAASSFFQEYFTKFHRITERLMERGMLRDDIDPVWTTISRMYSQLGTAFLYRQVEQITGTAPYSPEATEARVRTIGKIFREGVLNDAKRKG